MGDKIIAGNKTVFSREAFGRISVRLQDRPDKSLMLLHNQPPIAQSGIRRGDIHPYLLFDQRILIHEAAVPGHRNNGLVQC